MNNMSNVDNLDFPFDEWVIHNMKNEVAFADGKRISLLSEFLIARRRGETITWQAKKKQ
ncbi:MAG: hypothetical protein NVS3B3_09240 [Aquirhabdus sp.]